jgi:hypothetical protein
MPMTISNNMGRGSDTDPICPDAHFSSFLIGLISLFLAVKTAKYLNQINLFWLAIHPNFDSLRRFDRLSHGVLCSHSSERRGLCRNFSSSKSRPDGI